MDFRQTPQTNNSARPVVAAPSAPTPEHREEKELSGKKKQGGSSSKWIRIFNGILLVGVAILLGAIALVFTRGNTDNEFKFVNNKDYQAVFLNNGQVYFGNIDSLNGNYVRMSNIYYLTQTSDSSGTATATNNNYSLVKLGCQQIHDPYDQMLINRDQVTFWENLNGDGKVVASIKQFIKQNPNGPDCSQVSNQTQASNNTPTQGTGTGSTGTGTGSSTTK